jgi:hypothetical protein
MVSNYDWNRDFIVFVKGTSMRWRSHKTWLRWISCNNRTQLTDGCSHLEIKQNVSRCVTIFPRETRFVFRYLTKSCIIMLRVALLITAAWSAFSTRGNGTSWISYPGENVIALLPVKTLKGWEGGKTNEYDLYGYVTSQHSLWSSGSGDERWRPVDRVNLEV